MTEPIAFKAPKVAMPPRVCRGTRVDVQCPGCGLFFSVVLYAGHEQDVWCTHCGVALGGYQPVAVADSERDPDESGGGAA